MSEIFSKKPTTEGDQFQPRKGRHGKPGRAVPVGVGKDSTSPAQRPHRSKSAHSQLAQKIRNLRLRPVHRPDKLAPHHTLAVDNVCLRKPERPVELVAFPW